MKTHAWLCLFLAPLVIACYPTTIAPKTHIQIKTSEDRPITGVSGEYCINPYPSCDAKERMIQFQTDADGAATLPRQYVWRDIFTRTWCQFLNVLLPHGYDGPKANIKMTLPIYYHLNSQKTGADNKTRPYPSTFEYALGASTHNEDKLWEYFNEQEKIYEISILIDKPNHGEERAYKIVFDDDSRTSNRWNQ